MKTLREKVTFAISAIFYLLFNVKVAATLQDAFIGTLWHLARTAPFVIGMTFIIVAFFQYMANGEKMPWERRLRIFFAVGIMAGLLFAIWEYGGVNMNVQ